MSIRRCIAALALALIFPLAAFACGEDQPCKIGDRDYYIALPPGYDAAKPVPALIFLHGYKGRGLGSLHWKGLRAAAAELGAALITVQSKGDSWSMNSAPEDFTGAEAEELAYFDAMKADVTSRFAVNPDRMVIIGASSGGMAAWTLACERSAEFAGFVPMSGTFWAPMPVTCSGPVASIVHIHGDADTTVPLEGRALGGKWRQGSVSDALAMYRAYGKFGAPKDEALGDMRCQMSDNSAGDILDFCLFKGGHSFSPKHMVLAWHLLEMAKKL